MKGSNTRPTIVNDRTVDDLKITNWRDNSKYLREPYFNKPNADQISELKKDKQIRHMKNLEYKNLII